MRTAGQTMTWLRGSLARWEVFLLFVLFGTFICGAHVSRYFLTSSNISIALAGMTPAAIVALPMTLIIVTGEIDISVGSIVGLCSAFMAVCLEHGLPVEVAMLLGIVVGTLAGFVNGLIVVYAALPSLVVTIGTLALYRGIAQIILQERGISGFPEWYQNIGFGTIGGTPIPWSSDYLRLVLYWFRDFFARDSLGAGVIRNRQQPREQPVSPASTSNGLFSASLLHPEPCLRWRPSF